jgi:hypothetical protein
MLRLCSEYGYEQTDSFFNAKEQAIDGSKINAGVVIEFSKASPAGFAKLGRFPTFAELSVGQSQQGQSTWLASFRPACSCQGFKFGKLLLVGQLPK